MSTTLLFKDEVLNQLADSVNIAQFVSYGPDLKQRYSRLFELEPNHQFESILDAVWMLFKKSNGKSLNIRTYYPDSHQSQPFIYGLTEPYEVITNLIQLADKGLYIIIHETIDVNDNGVSGILQCGMLEFAPGVTVRFIEESTDPISVFTKKFGCELLKCVYGFAPDIDYPDTKRVEFSIHPNPIGYRQTKTIIWEIQDIKYAEIKDFNTWPTAFSKLIGDKAYGLLIGSMCGFKVPHTNVFPRNPAIDNFSFGESTGSSEVWMRTCPSESTPGKYINIRGWQDPFTLMEADDPSGKNIVSCLSQHEVSAKYSGATLTTDNGAKIEGVQGFGDNFMLGTDKPTIIPFETFQAITELHHRLVTRFGPVRFEWVCDLADNIWLLQLHLGKSVSSGRTIVPGEFIKSIDFDVALGLEHLRRIIDNISNNTGILVRGNIGMSSHICDVLRKANIPSLLVSA